ncbi:valine--tRNA ligase [Candidatus Uhrbacteria bacterium CG10_big_fil_rev_8_21_14_0_10_50_16]|uniref:Valine--tRNA ligase n=1 Tax=Candidatus Uhrbacteria bacterium CG10_big_fil_rev_8_21_14_0_10_50_16 TaxID=1975039 RepID=A0A2H0RLB7_9BACT|nr:MAG: valine--tRNA ligase [Candidatus Uhrbacteria bacterium CG10_big_fil_rev_8_21_14_0_10_50_16]
MPELPKAYEPSKQEDEIALKERESGLYSPENLPGNRTEVFSMVLPPPNATGTLHMGHAVMLAIQDILVRFARMQGKKTLWVPGTDHAAIATQVKVEKLLMKEEGKTRFDLGREVFLGRVDAFVEESRATIQHQVRSMGCSIDWTREAFTLDEPRNLAVRTMFKKMYDDGLIYRGYRVINWDPVGQTVISDDELVSKERAGKLYTFKYSKDFPITIATTRPETKVGDTAVAVHPSDERYKTFVGKTFNVLFAGAELKIKIIADEEVDPTFGTGALGVTPAHSVIDEGMAKRHNLEMIQVIDEQANMTEVAGTLVAGLPVLEARENIVAWLKDEGLLEAEEETTQMIATAERTGAVIEPLPKLQWFVDVEKEFAFKQSKHHPISALNDGEKVTLKSLMQHVVETKEVKIVPESFEKTYFHWINNLRPWCISRQLWYGHRVPAWYRGEDVFVGVDAPEGEGWIQDEDTLDTWFSAGMWTFSTLGWPNADAPDVQMYHPTTLLETGRDILFFWVARMILMSTYALGEVPFRYAYLHGMVRDDQGRKMSKSLDNIIDPLTMKETYGADATRLSLVVGSTPGNDVKLSEEKIAGFRNFVNKLWNIARFVFMSVSDVHKIDSAPAPVTDADAWILWELNRLIAGIPFMIGEPNFQLSLAAERLRDVTWSDFADWYVEVAKVQLQDPALKESTEDMLLYVLQCLLKMWHPYMPFVTTRLWEEFGSDKMLLIEDWPEIVSTDTKSPAVVNFENAKEIVTAIRATRASYKIDPVKTVDAIVTGETVDAMTATVEIIKRLGRVGTLTLRAGVERPEGSVSLVAGGHTIYIPLAGVIDLAAEKTRLQAELASVEAYTKSVGAKLNNQGFVDNAPAEAVQKEQEKLAEATARRDALQQQLEAFS